MQIEFITPQIQRSGMSAEQGFTRRARISRRYAIEMTITKAAIFCVWDPKQPDKLTRKEMRRYEALRDAAVAELAANLGQSVIVAELNGGFAPEGA